MIDRTVLTNKNLPLNAVVLFVTGISTFKRERECALATSYVNII